MKREGASKLKILALAELFYNHTDVNNPMTMQDITSYLQEWGIPCERKSIYSDIDTINDFAVNVCRFPGNVIEHTCGRNSMWWFNSFPLSKEAMSSLRDLILSSEVLSLEEKISLFHRAGLASSQISLNQLKTGFIILEGNRKHRFAHTIDVIQQAVRDDVQIKYRINEENWAYFSPYALSWINKSCYLLGWDHEKDAISHMDLSDLPLAQATKVKRKTILYEGGSDLNLLWRNMLTTLQGESDVIKIRFARALKLQVKEYFSDRMLALEDDIDGTFIITVQVICDKAFWQWLFSFGPQAELLEPVKRREEFRHRITQTLARYCDHLQQSSLNELFAKPIERDEQANQLQSS